MICLVYVGFGLLWFSHGVYAAPRSVVPSPHFVPLHSTPSDSAVTLTLALPPTNIEGLHTALYDVSNPASPKYGKHLSKAEVEAFVAPKPESIKAVTNWLATHDLKPEVVSSSGDMLRINLPVSTANSLLSANFTEFLDKNTHTTLTRTLSITIPAEVEDHVQFVFPTTQYVSTFISAPISSRPSVEVVQPPKSLSKRATPPAMCSQQIYPECLQDLYNIPTAAASASNNSLAVSGYLSEMATEDDLSTFFTSLRTDVATAPTFEIVSVDSGITSGNGTLEASLDIQYTVGIATGVPTTFYSVGDSSATGFIDLVNYFLAQDEVPLVLSTSYGFNEIGFTGSEDVAQTFCNAYAQLGARGTSVIFCSGDNGVYSFGYNSQCSAAGTTFGPTFPSTCPFLTSVGGTQGINPEVVAPFSSGGFSNIFARPDYQSSAVSSYLAALGSTNSGLYNTTGRGFPDVSAQALNYLIRESGAWELVLGTSASTPTFASIVALLNDERLKAGKAPLGFVNPLLYSQGANAFNDITNGTNNGCGAEGFPALAGWDAATGLGTPDYSKLLSVVMAAAQST
ncbi:family S53 protease [Lentinus tigrinus ALCF2SS1-7]|uniref:tripeptidyl-peptidase II n=1 Tax=Lentinus tigrinus ALCF2SS1-6 TaxID=1328759 RepID=A0A5C2S4H3_9APHY|nr:family S53 protease [Lentinus tigrinus ALCF2SS1-6]RPD69037.1 family S53 protease [Lentinus tigrinus ALCF2SS1-7]